MIGDWWEEREEAPIGRLAFPGKNGPPRKAGPTVFYSTIIRRNFFFPNFNS